MSRQKLTVVISQAQGKNPVKRALEESLAAALLMESGIDLSIVPYLYDLDANHTGRLFLESIQGDMAIVSWLYPRAAYWLLDRDGIKGHYGENNLKAVEEDDEETTGNKTIDSGPGRESGLPKIAARLLNEFARTSAIGKIAIMV